jgi:predicted ATPase
MGRSKIRGQSREAQDWQQKRKEIIMKKTDKDIDDMASEYDFSNGVRGKHQHKLEEGYTVTVYSPTKNTIEKQISDKTRYVKIDKDVNEYFVTSEEINNALRAIIKAIPQKRIRVNRSVVH